MEVKAGYNQTEVGVIPEEWDLLPFDAIFRKARTKNHQIQTNEYQQSGMYPVIDQGQASIVGYSDREDKVFHVADDGVVIFGDHTCIVKFVRHDFVVGADGTQILIARERQHAEFHSYALMHRGVEATGYNRHYKFLKERSFQAPPLSEQRAIATALSDMDAPLGGLDRLIAKKRDLKQAAMQQLLTGQTRLPGFSGEWKVVEFGDVAVIRNTKVVASSTPDGTQCVELEHITQGTGRLLMSAEASGLGSKYSFKKGDVLFGRLRAYLRKYWLAAFDGVCSTEIWPLIARDGRLDGSFLYWVVQTNDFVNAAGLSYGTHMPRSDWSVLKKVPLRLPSLSEQSAIAAVLSDMDVELTALEARRDKTRDLKQAMMQELLTGKTRLVPSGAAHA